MRKVRIVNSSNVQKRRRRVACKCARRNIPRFLYAVNAFFRRLFFSSAR